MHNKLMHHAWDAPLDSVSHVVTGAVAFTLSGLFRPNFALQRTRLIRLIQVCSHWMGFCYFLVHR